MLLCAARRRWERRHVAHRHRAYSRLIPDLSAYARSFRAAAVGPRRHFFSFSPLAPSPSAPPPCNIRVCANVIHDAITNHFEETASIGTEQRTCTRASRSRHKTYRCVRAFRRTWKKALEMQEIILSQRV